MDENEFDPETAGVLSAGSVEYSAAEAAVPIDKMIALLEEMKEDGIETVLMSSGNYRGAKWQAIGAGWGWLSES